MKYSDKENVNTLTALLVAHGIGHAVVCPGSRNAPIVHNLGVCPQIICHPVTDERSAGFYALGLSQATKGKVAVCVTSGSALLNLLPAVAEASYQRVGMVVISADRPLQWIGQQDGQTIPQHPVSQFFAKEVSLPEPSNDEERWLCNRLVNEALMLSDRPVHINVPISEPLFSFTAGQLPTERTVIAEPRCRLSNLSAASLWQRLTAARRPLVVMGQMACDEKLASDALAVASRVVVLAEPLSLKGATMLDEAVMAVADDARYEPDMVIYGGGHIVSKRLKQYLRKAAGAEMWQISEDGELCDTFQHATHVVTATMNELLGMLAERLNDDGNAFVNRQQVADYHALWTNLFSHLRNAADSFAAPYSQLSIVRLLENRAPQLQPTAERHYANSMSVRLGCCFSGAYIHCNRGVNGIEGSLSAAAGFSLATTEKVVCVIGDLSFFYDQNALWNSEIAGNLRILLLNNGGGGIFGRFSGLKASPARNSLVMACHETSAEGICQQHDIYYQRATTQQETEQAIELLLTADLSRPMLVECVTNADIDQKVLDSFAEHLMG